LRQGQMPGPLGFAGAAGYQTDADTGLMLLGNRYYDASIGRFLSPDPSGSGDNWYAYCDNAPLDAVDPEGLMGVPTPTGASFGNPLGQMESAIGMASSGHWDHGVPIKYGKTTGQPYAVASNGDDYVATHWVPDDSGYFQLTAGRPKSYERGEENGIAGTYKNYKDGSRVFEPDPSAPVKKTGHGDKGRNVGAEEEHSRNAKGNRTPRSTGGGHRFVQVGVLTIGGYLAWEGLKWTAAAFAAPETLGLSLALAGATP